MTNLDAIWNQARSDLVIIAKNGDQDLFLWEHSAQVARYARLIARCPIVEEQSPDELAIMAAALYHDAGWSASFRDGEVARTDILTRAAPDTHREKGASLMERSLAGLVPGKTLRRASEAVRALNDRAVELVEAHVVADADNLGEFCLLALWTTARRSMLDGKGVQAAIDTWHRRKEYQFWTARLNDSFRFAPVRELARTRLARFERAMAELEEHYLGTDITVVLSAGRGDRVGEPATR